jgi:hypothetical protein
MNHFLERGGILAWGIVPTGDADKLRNENTGSLKAKMEDLIRLFRDKGMKEELFLEQMLLTPSCGMGSGSLTVKDSEQVLRLLSGV